MFCLFIIDNIYKSKIISKALWSIPDYITRITSLCITSSVL